MLKDSDPWEWLPEESARAYDAFCCYREMGHQRSIAKVAHAIGRSVRLLERWSSAHRWVVRAFCYDNYLDLRQRRNYELRVLETASEHAAQARAVQERALARLSSIDVNRLTISQLMQLVKTSMELELKAYEMR